MSIRRIKKVEKYSLGLDIGTNSVGWAVVDENNQIVKKNGFALWGVRMFEEANDASERRSYRSSRRRLNRRKERITLLRSLFAEEISKIDKTFFERLDDSFYIQADKRENCFYNLLNDKSMKPFFKQNPTIYHIRKYLLEHDEKIDIRILYLVMHHMIKYRGNFLNPSEEFNKQDFSTIKGYFNDINMMMDDFIPQFEDNEDYFEKITIKDDTFFEELKDILNGKLKKNEKKAQLQSLFGVSKNTLVSECIIPLLVGSKVDLSKLSVIKNMQYDKVEIDISDDNYIVAIDEARGKIKELFSLYDVMVELKEIVDHYYLLKILVNYDNISEVMVNIYQNHYNELKELKKLIRTYDPKDYDLCFRIHDDKINNYPKYIGMNNVNSNMERFSHCKREDFYKYIKNILDKITDSEAQETIASIKEKIENTEYLLRQNSDKNGSFPMQLNLFEMKKILKIQSKYYDFLLKKDGNFSTIDKIISIFKYKIPYYVGPLNNKSEKSWVVRTNEKIYPWNFDKVVDLDASAIAFIQKMQNKCTYLKGDDDYCIPKNSLLFSEFNCLQYINKLQINGKPISVEQKEKLFNELFLVKNPTKKDVFNFLKLNYGFDDIREIPEVNCNMASYIKFKEIFGDEFEQNKDNIEKIIQDIVIFEDKALLEKRLKNVYKLDNEKIKRIKDLNYKGYSSLSRKLLSELVSIDQKTGEVYGTIIELLRKTTLNFQQLLFDPNYNFNRVIDEYNESILSDKNDDNFETFIDEHIYTSPIMKRPLIQAYKIIEEVEKILGQKIDKYYIECARYHGAKEVKKSRYNNLKELYKNCVNLAQQFNINMKALNEKLDANQDKLKSDKIYLYFTQLGKCMYTLEDIDFNDIVNNYKYDIDHIYPQSIIKDDSFSNTVLTRKDRNNIKTDKFIFDDSLNNFLPPNAYRFYQMLLDSKLITKEKYRRLTQKEIKPEELEGFVNRQLVTTNQAVKGLIELLKLYRKVDPIDIIYSKAQIISDFRNEFGFPKSREANNYHHAHDAYLNVVVGRTIHNYYLFNHFTGFVDYYRLRNEGKTINPLKIFANDRVINGRVLWKKEKMLKLIDFNLYNRFDIHETTRVYKPNEMFSKVTIQKAGTESAIPVKTSDYRKNIDVYGGFTSNSYSRYVIIKVMNKKRKEEYILESIPRMYDDNDKVIANKKINDYLASLYDNYQILNNDIRRNVIIKLNKLKFTIKGKTNDAYIIINKWDKYFEKKFIITIKKIYKYKENIKNDYMMAETENSIIIVPQKNKETKEVELTINEVKSLYKELIKIYSKDIYQHSIITKIKNNMIAKEYDLSLKDYINLLFELLKLLRTNEEGLANLKVLNMKEFTGKMKISKRLKPGMKFIYESITGYYSKVLFEVPSDGI